MNINECYARFAETIGMESECTAYPAGIITHLHFDRSADGFLAVRGGVERNGYAVEFANNEVCVVVRVWTITTHLLVLNVYNMEHDWEAALDEVARVVGVPADVLDVDRRRVMTAARAASMVNGVKYGVKPYHARRYSPFIASAVCHIAFKCGRGY